MSVSEWVVCSSANAAFHSSADPHTSAWIAFPTDGPENSEPSTSVQLSRTSTEESRGEVLQQEWLRTRRVRFFWLCAVKLHGEGERRRLRDLLQPAPVNQSQPIKSLVGFISSRSHLWLQLAELEAVTPELTKEATPVRRPFSLFFLLSGALQDAGCGVGS